MLPVSRAIDRFYEFTAEQRREKILGQGIFLSTIHSSKGMEFPHVFILDGDWGRPSGKNEWEEERRVMYVGMTRAEETLRLMKIPAKPNPFLREIRGDFVISKTYTGNEIENGFQNKCYELIGLSEIYMDYAGCFHRDNRIHKHLCLLRSWPDVLHFIKMINRLRYTTVMAVAWQNYQEKGLLNGPGDWVRYKN